MKSEEISKLAKECVDALMADKQFKDENERKKAAEVEFLYAIDCVKTILKDHCIVSRVKVIMEHSEAMADVAFESEINDTSHMNQALGRMAVLQKLFGTELFEERSEE